MAGYTLDTCERVQGVAYWLRIIRRKVSGMYTSSIHTALDIALSNESTRIYNRAIKNIALLITSDRETYGSFTTHEENIYIIGASQALMVVFDKEPDEIERDIRMSVQELEF